jgi:hypothetical protein
MSAHGFFGDVSAFQIIVSTAALASLPISIYTVYKSFFERAKVASTQAIESPWSSTTLAKSVSSTSVPTS